ncbi:MAG: XRE family transcriptional regulator [Clostridia bacterium]|nr:XRE family transcriptional regulator [Clostridia bacterium]NLS85380.1 helix-turn-helix transcriptional regulator [Oscillospiraceae bacterium]
MLGDCIRNLRMTKNVTQVELAHALSVTKQSVSNWENGNIQPSIDMLIQLAEFFHVSTDYLLGRNEKRTLNAENLTPEQIVHVQNIIDDILA